MGLNPSLGRGCCCRTTWESQIDFQPLGFEDLVGLCQLFEQLCPCWGVWCKLAAPAVFQDHKMIFCRSGSLGCDSALSGKSPQLCYPGFHMGRILTSLNSVFSTTYCHWFLVQSIGGVPARFSAAHQLYMQGMAGNARTQQWYRKCPMKWKNLPCAFEVCLVSSPVNASLWLPQTSVEVFDWFISPCDGGSCLLKRHGAAAVLPEGSELSCTWRLFIFIVYVTKSRYHLYLTWAFLTLPNKPSLKSSFWGVFCAAVQGGSSWNCCQWRSSRAVPGA